MVLETIGESDYKIKLIGDYNVSATFNICDLSPYLVDGYHLNLRIYPFQ